MDNKSQGIVAVIIAHNEMKYVKLNVRILFDELKGSSSEVVIVDNYSDDGLREWLEGQNNVSYIICDEKMEGYGEILRVVVEQFGYGRDLLLLRANYFFTAGSIAYMRSALYSREEIAAVGPMCNAFSGEQKCFAGETFAEAEKYQASQENEIVKTAYLHQDVMLMKGTTLSALGLSAIPQAVVRGYMRNVLKDGSSLAVVKKSVCFSVSDVNDSAYRAFDPECYRQEKLHQLLYSFGDIAYQGIYLYKYLETDFRACINYHNKYQKMERSKFREVWKACGIALSTKEEAQKAKQVIAELPAKDVMFVTLPIRRNYQGRLVHTAMESFIASLDERLYMDLELYTEDFESILKYCPTKNMYPILESAIPTIYGVGDVEERELLDFIWLNFVHPLELTLDIKFEDELLKSVWLQAQYILRKRKSYIQFYKEAIARVNPKVIIYSHGPDILLTYLRDAALELGIPTLEIAHGVGKVDTYHKQLVYADYHVVYSDIVAALSREHGNHRVIGVGKPGVYEGTGQREPKKPVIIITFISSMEYEIFDYARNLAVRLDASRFVVIYKAHNTEIWEKEEKDKIEKEIPNLKFMNGACDIRDCVDMSDIVVGIRSSGIFDALVYPMVKVIAVEDKALNYSEARPDDILQEVIANGEVTLARDEEQLYQEVVNYQRGVMYREEVNSFWPGDAGDRFRALVDSFL